MADGYLESRYEDYEKRKAQWLKKKKHIVQHPLRQEDEAL
jgi:hypothetical protein